MIKEFPGRIGFTDANASPEPNDYNEHGGIYLHLKIQYAQIASPLWLAMTRDIDFSRPDLDEVKLHAAIMKSEGLPRQKAVVKK